MLVNLKEILALAEKDGNTILPAMYHDLEKKAEVAMKQNVLAALKIFEGR